MKYTTSCSPIRNRFKWQSATQGWATQSVKLRRQLEFARVGLGFGSPFSKLDEDFRLISKEKKNYVTFHDSFNNSLNKHENTSFRLPF